MRPILFRGKRLDSGEWGYGYYCNVGPAGHEHHYIIPHYASAFYGSEVDPATVGQDTGLRDKHGVRVFEGDILECTDRIVYVKWHDQCGCWDSQFARYTGKPLCSNGISAVEWKYRATVIGNIRDTPDLVRRTQEEPK